MKGGTEFAPSDPKAVAHLVSHPPSSTLNNFRQRMASWSEALGTPPPRLTRVRTHPHSRADRDHLCLSSRNWPGSAPHLQALQALRKSAKPSAPPLQPLIPSIISSSPAFPHLPEPESKCQAYLISCNPPWGNSTALGQERSFWLLILQLLVSRQFRLLTRERYEEGTETKNKPPVPPWTKEVSANIENTEQRRGILKFYRYNFTFYKIQEQKSR